MNKSYTIPKSALYDYCKTGFYSYKNNENLHLRIQDSDLELQGVIRLNKNNQQEPTFEGFNGTKWIQFNALKGDQGEKGTDFNNQFQFKNCDEDDEETNKDKGFIFKTNTLDTNISNYVNIRCIEGGNKIINEKPIKTMKVTTKEDSIELQSLPQPYNWDISNLSINDMKSNNNDNIFKCYGKTVICNVKENYTINKGQFVSLINTGDVLEVIPFEYEGDLDLFLNPISVFGVALEDSKDKNKIHICTEGITTVKYCMNLNDDIENNMMGLSSINKLHSYGILSRRGYVFYSPLRPGVDYIKVGTFLETGNHNYVLFNIKI